MPDDLSLSTVEPMCTPLDILMAANLHAGMTNIHELMEFCLKERELIDDLKHYSEAGLQATTPWASFPVPGAIFEDPRGEISNRPSSLGIEGINDEGLRTVKVIGTKANLFTQMYVIVFTDASGGFSVTAQIEGAQGTGSTAADFTTSNGDVTIQADAWYGSPKDKSRFYFSTYRWLPKILEIAKYRAAGKLLTLKYMHDSIKKDGLATAFMDFANNEIKAYNMPWDKKEGKKLATLAKPTLGVLAKPYVVDLAGRDGTEYATEDFIGNKGDPTGWEYVSSDWPQSCF